MKLIDKDAVLAEIKELSSAIKIQLDYKKGDAFWIAQKLLLERLKGKINSLEVKEVDDEPGCKIFPRPIECSSTCKECPFANNKY